MSGPFIRALPPEGGFPEPCPDGWVTRPVGAWHGEPSEIVYSPLRHVVVLVDGPRRPLTQSLIAAGWTLHDVDAARGVDCWVRDRVAVARARLAISEFSPPAIGGRGVA